MHTETNNTKEITSPPLPPAAVFDEQHMADAKPVRPLRNRQSRKFAAGFQHIFARRFTAIATMIAGMMICVGIGAASVDWNPGKPSSKDDTAQAATEPLAPSTAPPTSNGSSMERQDPKRRTFLGPQARKTRLTFQLSEDENGRKIRPRLVTVIH